MTLSIRTFPAGPIDTNAYLVVDDETKHAFVVDAPLDVTEAIADASEGITIERIVITHTHWDHIGDAAALKQRLGVPLAAHPGARANLEQPGSQINRLPFEIDPVTPDVWLDEGDTVTLGEHAFRVLHLPGHDPSHIALYSEPDRVFLGGDVLFPNGHGRTDIPGSDQETMNRSLARLARFPADVVVYPGHGATTTIGKEAWLQRLAE